jgi:hypothetical protein
LVKRDGLCGVHAAVADRSKKHDEAKRLKNERGCAAAKELTSLLGITVRYDGYGHGESWILNSAEVNEWWNELDAKGGEHGQS